MNRLAATSVALVLAALATTASAQTPSPSTVDLKSGSGQTVGQATLTQAGSSVEIRVTASGLAPGQHGIHLHAVGQCDGPDFTTAGGHFNPASKQHGLKNPQGPHAGDMPNLEVGADGRANQTFRTDMVTLVSGPTSVFDADGTALVIHAMPDDEMTDPAGNSGPRIACAVVARGTAPAAAAPAAAPAAAAPAAQTAARPAAQPAQLPRTGLAGPDLAGLGLALGGLLLGAGDWARRRGR
jgi:superoxide dismutase, Cu-Zn family